MVNFTLRLIYSRERTSVSTELGGTQNGTGRFEDVQNLLFLPGFEAQTLQPVYTACIKTVSLQRRQIHNKT